MWAQGFVDPLDDTRSNESELKALGPVMQSMSSWRTMSQVVVDDRFFMMCLFNTPLYRPSATARLQLNSSLSDWVSVSTTELGPHYEQRCHEGLDQQSYRLVEGIELTDRSLSN